MVGVGYDYIQGDDAPVILLSDHLIRTDRGQDIWDNLYYQLSRFKLF